MFNRADSPDLQKTNASSGDRKTWTFSAWIKRSNLTGVTMNFFSGGTDGDNQNYTRIQFNADDDIYIAHVDGGSTTTEKQTDMKFRDPGAWYHVLWVLDTTQGSAADREKLYVNGTEVTSFSTNTTPAQDYETTMNEDVEMFVGNQLGTWEFMGCYFAEVCFIGGSALTPSSFGEFDEDSPTIWKPIDVSGLTFGTNGFYLDFEDSADLGADVSGNSNDFTVSNLDATNQATDTPTNNFCTLNPLIPTTEITFSEGNCKTVTHASSDNYGAGVGTFGLTAGKWYWEIKMASLVVNHNHGVISELTAELCQNVAGLQNDVGATVFRNDDGGEMIKDGTQTTADYGTLDDGDIMGIAFNADDNEISIYDNGSLIVDGYTISTTRGTLFPLIKTGVNTTAAVNFGGCSSFTISSAASDENNYGNFEIAPPSGYLALCSKNLGSDGG
jgi:hypothetical protein